MKTGSLESGRASVGAWTSRKRQSSAVSLSLGSAPVARQALPCCSDQPLARFTSTGSALPCLPFATPLCGEGLAAARTASCPPGERRI